MIILELERKVELPRIPNYGYKQIIPITSDLLFGITHDSIKKNYNLQILRDFKLSIFQLPIREFDYLGDHSHCFVVNKTPYILLRNDTLIKLKESFSDYEVIKIENSELINISNRFSNPMFSPNLMAGKSDSLRFLKSFDFNTNGDFSKLAFLRFHKTQNRASWEKFEKENRLGFSKSKFHANLKIEDYIVDPKFKSNKNAPIISNTLVRNNELFIFSIGNINTKSSGQSFSSLTKLDSNLDVSQQLFFEKHCLVGDYKKRGKSGVFTSSYKYCIITPKYVKSDSWGGKQRLFDLESNRIIEVKKPRGLAKFKIVEHIDGVFWLESFDKEKGVNILAKCNIV